MLIKMTNIGVVEWPDLVGIWILADPSHGECSETFSFEQINGLLHAGVALLYEEGISIEENAKNIIREFLSIELPSNKNWGIATKLVCMYNSQVTENNIGIVSKDFF